MLNDEDMEILKHFQSRLPVDQFSLEKENSQQPALLDEVGQWVSGIKADAKTAKEHIEYVKADLSLKIRKDPVGYGLEEKPKEGAISSAITTHKAYQQAVVDYIEANRLSDEASVLLSSVEQRKSSISNLVRLFIHAYYSSDKPISNSDWKNDEEAIIALRDRKAQKQDVVTDDLEESEI